MVLTNFECWAHGGINGSVVNTDSALDPNDIETMRRNNRGVDMFNPRSVSQISSNGYYGFSHINPTMNTVSDNAEQDQQEDSNNNNNNNNNNNQLMENCANAGSVGGAVRCKKRFYVGDMEIDNFFSNATNTGSAVAAKRCRYDDADMAAQYCNDFFSMPVTQIGTQSCLMDIEEQQNAQLQQVHVDEAMTIGQIKNAQQSSAAINHPQLQQVQTQQPHDQQQHQQHQHHHHNQHYQGHLHRANRDLPYHSNQRVENALTIGFIDAKPSQNSKRTTEQREKANTQSIKYKDQTPTVRKKLATKENSVKHLQKNPAPAWPDDSEADSAANAADMFMCMHGGSLQQFVLQSLNEHKDNDNFFADI